MNNMINYDDYDFKKNNNNIQNVVFKLINIRLLEKPSFILYNNNQYTLLKIICTKKIKIFLKKIEKSLDNNILINYDINQNLDYYEIVINKKIEKLVNSLDNSNYYDIGISLCNIDNNINTILLWKLYSIELNNNNNNNSDELEYDPDYYEIKKDILNKLVKKTYSLNNDLNKINTELVRLEKLYNNIENKFIINKIDNYYNTI
jgi:hypothetical protein